MTGNLFFKKAQSTLELSILIAIIAAALISISVYMKRALSGKYRQIADGVSEQYSPLLVNSDLMAFTNTTIIRTIEREADGTPSEPLRYNIKTQETREQAGAEEIGDYGSEPFF